MKSESADSKGGYSKRFWVSRDGSGSNWDSLLILFGLLGVLCASAPGQLRAQAAPGPMAPPPAAEQPAPPQPSSAPRARTSAATAPAEKPAPRSNIGGSWNLNPATSDNARDRIDQARRGGPTRQSGGNGPYGGNGPGGNGPWGGGGGYPPYPGGNGPYGGPPYGGNGPWGGNQGGAPRGGYGNESDNSPQMREYIYPASEVTFILKDNEADLTDDAARKRVFFTDGRKLEKPKDENYREIAAHWEGSRLVAEEKMQGGERVRRVFELSSDGRQLNEEVDLEATKARGPVTLHYVYEINASRQ